MNLQEDQSHKPQEEQHNASTTGESSDALEDDGTPVIDEQDLEENDLSVEEAEDIEWDEPREG